MIDAWMTASPDHAHRIARLQHLVGEPLGPVTLATAADLRARVWAAVDNTLGVPATVTRPQPRPAVAPPKQRGRLMSRGVMFAGAIGLVAVAVLGVLIVGTNVFRARPSTSPTFARTYTADRAQRTTVQLADGSTVVLAPETRLTYITDASGARVATLVGEAFFTVASQTHRPFLVRTGVVTTRVLGTAFDVRRYASDLSTQVAVISGRVSVGGEMTPVVLNAGSTALATDSTVTVGIRTDPMSTISWTQGRLVFDNAPVSAMLAALSRWYGYEFRLADTTLATRHVSIVLATDQAAETMNTVKALLRVTMTFDGNIVTLVPEHGVRTGVHRQGLSTNSEREVGR